MHPKSGEVASIEPLRDSSKVNDIAELHKRLGHWDEIVVASAARRLAEIQGVAAMSSLLEVYEEYKGDFPPFSKRIPWDDDPGEVIPALQSAITKLSGGAVKLPKNMSRDERDRFFRDAKAWWKSAAPKPQSKTELIPTQRETSKSIGTASSASSPGGSSSPTPAVSTGHRAPVWSWVVGVATLVAIVWFALKCQRSR